MIKDSEKFALWPSSLRKSPLVQVDADLAFFKCTRHARKLGMEDCLRTWLQTQKQSDQRDSKKHIRPVTLWYIWMMWACGKFLYGSKDFVQILKCIAKWLSCQWTEEFSLRNLELAGAALSVMLKFFNKLRLVQAQEHSAARGLVRSRFANCIVERNDKNYSRCIQILWFWWFVVVPQRLCRKNFITSGRQKAALVQQDSFTILPPTLGSTGCKLRWTLFRAVTWSFLFLFLGRYGKSDDDRASSAQPPQTVRLGPFLFIRPRKLQQILLTGSVCYSGVTSLERFARF